MCTNVCIIYAHTGARVTRVLKEHALARDFYPVLYNALNRFGTMVTIVIFNSYCTFNAPKNIYFYPNKFFCCCKVGLKTSLLYPLLCICVSQANDGSTNIADITVLLRLGWLVVN